jgi:hypothetical protein
MRHLIMGAALALACAGQTGCGNGSAKKGAGDGGNGERPAAEDRGRFAEVTVFVAREAQEAGVAVIGARAGMPGEEGNEVRLALSFAKPVETRVLLHAVDENNVELGRAKSQNLSQPAGSTMDVPILFGRHLDPSGVHHYNMELIPQKALVLSGDAAGPPELVKGKDKEPLEIRLGRMREDTGPPIRVRLDVAFVTPFLGELQLRAHDASGTEVGRSGRSVEVDQEAGSSRTLEFVFHETLSAASVESYELFVRGSEGPKTKKRKS